MRRREFITLLGCAVTWPVALKAQSTERVRDLLAPIYGWFTEGFDTLDALVDGVASVVLVHFLAPHAGWELQQHPRLWHSRAGEGAVHSINSGNWRCLFD